jgi:excisionase family DNA binding protein
MSMNPPNPTQLGLTVREAAAATSFSEWEIREAVNRGEIPARRRGRRISIDAQGLRDWFHSLPSVADGSEAS